MDGWYATGQMYAGIQAELGVKWRDRKVSIMNIYAAVALQAKLPNPFWAQGNVGGKYSVLGGLVQGHCNFQMTIGKECDIVGSIDPNLMNPKEKIVKSITPSDNDEEVSVFSSPTIELNYPLNTIIKDEDTGKKYWIEFVEAPVLKTKDGYTMYLNQVLDASETRVELRPYDILGGNTEMILTYSVHMKEDGKIVPDSREDKAIHFKTGAAEMTLPGNNIIATYPRNGQYNFYLKEVKNDKGYIYMRLRQQYLFAPKDGAKDVVHKMRFTAKSGNCFMTNIEYKNILHEPRIEIDMPAAKFTKGEVYRMDLITFAKADDSPTACVPDAKVIRNLYTAYFRTSTFDKVTDKINAAFATQTQVSLPNLDIILPKPNTVEPFDQFEITNSGKLQSAFCLQ